MNLGPFKPFLSVLLGAVKNWWAKKRQKKVVPVVIDVPGCKICEGTEAQKHPTHCPFCGEKVGHRADCPTTYELPKEEMTGKHSEYAKDQNPFMIKPKRRKQRSGR